MVWCIWMRRKLSYLSFVCCASGNVEFLIKDLKIFCLMASVWVEDVKDNRKVCWCSFFFSNSVSFTRDRLSVFLIKRIISVTHLCSVSKYRQVTNWSHHDSNPARRWNSKKPFSLHRSFLFFSLKLVFLSSLLCLRNESLLHYSAKWRNFESCIATLWV